METRLIKMRMEEENGLSKLYYPSGDWGWVWGSLPFFFPAIDIQHLLSTPQRYLQL